MRRNNVIDNLSMKDRTAALRLFLCAVALVSTASIVAVEKIPEFKLKDPMDKEYTHKYLLAVNTVVMISIPNAKHGENQERWMALLEKSLPDSSLQIVVLEDLSQSDVVQDATEGMKERFKPGQRPLLLVDETGDVRRAFGVPDDKTAILVCDRMGTIVYRVSDITDPDKVREAAKGVVQAAKNLSSVSSAQNK
jgi:hypothetical protein